MGMTVPMVGPDGTRQTVNANLSTAQTTWNLRSALNVAALNCVEPQYDGLVDRYGSFLKNNSRKLSATNRALEKEFRQKYGPTFRNVQDSYMTQVYNYFALPPALDNFCDVAMSVSAELPQVADGDLDSFAARAMPRIEGVFEDFFSAYEKYRVDLAAWNQQYGPSSTTTTVPGFAQPAGPAAGGVPAPVQATVVPASSAQPADGSNEPKIVLPQEGPIFKSGEVVQGKDAADTGGAANEADAVDDTPVP